MGGGGEGAEMILGSEKWRRGEGGQINDLFINDFCNSSSMQKV